MRDLLLALQPSGGSPHGEDWTRCSERREAIQHRLVEGLRLTKIRKLLARQGVSIGYPTLYSFAVEQLQFGRAATTIPVLDGEPGQEVQVDTGWVGWLTEESPSCALRPNVFLTCSGQRRCARRVACHRQNVQAPAEYETNPSSSTSRVYWTMNGIMLRRPTGTSPIATYRIGADDRITAPT